MHFSRIFKIKEGKVDRVREWFAQLSGPRKDEAIATFAYEYVTRESFVLFKGNDGQHYCIGFNELDPNAPETIPGPSDKTVPINQEHTAMKKECFEGFSENGEILMDLKV